MRVVMVVRMSPEQEREEMLSARHHQPYIDPLERARDEVSEWDYKEAKGV